MKPTGRDRQTRPVWFVQTIETIARVIVSIVRTIKSSVQASESFAWVGESSARVIESITRTIKSSAQAIQSFA